MVNLYSKQWLWAFLTGLLMVAGHVAQATHIVGGELELRYLGTQSANTHRINLNLYFDDINGNIGANDAVVSVGIFAKRTNALIGYVILGKTSEEFVPYTNSTCTTAYVRTRLIKYGTELTLDPNVFNDAGGYYMSWERCCRNGTIVNILNPGRGGIYVLFRIPGHCQRHHPLCQFIPHFHRSQRRLCVRGPALYA